MSETTRMKTTTKQHARYLRREMTDAEKLLWRHLRMGQLVITNSGGNIRSEITSPILYAWKRRWFWRLTVGNTQSPPPTMPSGHNGSKQKDLT